MPSLLPDTAGRALALLALLFACFRAEGAELRSGPVAVSPDTGDRFSFVINADPQMGPRDGEHANERHLYDLLAQFVGEVNAREEQPAFVVFNGDLVAFPRPAYFAAFREAVTPLKVPAVLVHGNHDGRHPDTQFLDLQEALCGHRALWYSFDAGHWHFVVIPAKEQLPKQDDIAALKSWLEADLTTNAGRPTMVLLHYHLLPMGLSQGEYYTLPMVFKRDLIDLFIRHKVRYVVSGHVHCGIQSSIKASWTFKGTHFLVAPSPVAPRNFGEEFPRVLSDSAADEGYYLDVHIDGEEARFVGRKIGSDVKVDYPARFAEFDPSADPRVFIPCGHWPFVSTLVNGDFAAGFDGWHFPHRYQADEQPGFARRTASQEGEAGAYLFAREKGHSWAYDEFIECYQVVSLADLPSPVVRADYRVPREGWSPFGGGYLRVTGYDDGAPEVYFLFHWGAREERVRHLPQAILYSDYGQQKGLGFFHDLAAKGRVLHWKLPDYPDRRHRLVADLAALYDGAAGESGAFAMLGLDTLLVAPGVWAGMEAGSTGAAWFEEIRLVAAQDGTASTIDGTPLPIDDEVFRVPYGRWYLQGFDK